MKTNTALFFITLIIGFAKANDPDGVQFKKIVFKDNKVVAFRSFNMDKVESWKKWEKIELLKNEAFLLTFQTLCTFPCTFKISIGIIRKVLKVA